MEKPYINLKELSELLGKGRNYSKKIMNHLLEIAREKNYYIPDGREILIPTHLVKKELKMKEINLENQKGDIYELRRDFKNE